MDIYLPLLPENIVPLKFDLSLSLFETFTPHRFVYYIFALILGFGGWVILDKLLQRWFPRYYYFRVRCALKDVMKEKMTIYERTTNMFLGGIVPLIFVTAILWGMVEWLGLPNPLAGVTIEDVKWELTVHGMLLGSFVMVYVVRWCVDTYRACNAPKIKRGNRKNREEEKGKWLFWTWLVGMVIWHFYSGPYFRD
ncbi:hypothetical protein FPQ18DRAFT_394100 [Pyronema domesticum]|uniref:Uncharacterized protein n=1 Tax=Pyronema omphalodes (strain CBS 100304) TaxID=1076935 RepID=U4LRW4_PYROM|nr:hypothetical protein FPQ18DRAFT_394100 [Pyronema domesticum]CCX34700.1 Protein of unknown function [Pyronema omphalodes CBS 100304]